jgi:hypothetical protein
VFINRTFNHRVAQHYSDNSPNFDIERSAADNYFPLSLKHHMWLSGGSGSKLHIIGNNSSHPIKDEITASLKDKSISEQNQQYNDQWFDSVDQLYNFKHIIKLELLPLRNNSAQHQLNEAYSIPRKMFLEGKTREELLVEEGLVHSPTDDHWSPKANSWVLENYILTQETIDILTNS